MLEKIAIYGGSFNPPTIWHEAIITQTLTRWFVDKIIFVPDWEREDKKYQTTRLERLSINQVFIEELKDKWYRVDLENYFLNKNWFVRTVDVDRYFLEKNWSSPHHIFWSDVIDSMPNWSWNSNRFLQDKLKKIFILRKWFLLPENIDMQNYEFLDLDIPPVSSTMVRETLKNRLSVNHLLTPWVNDFIKQNNLYI